MKVGINEKVPRLQGRGLFVFIHFRGLLGGLPVGVG